MVLGIANLQLIAMVAAAHLGSPSPRMARLERYFKFLSSLLSLLRVTPSWLLVSVSSGLMALSFLFASFPVRLYLHRNTFLVSSGKVMSFLSILCMIQA